MEWRSRLDSLFRVGEREFELPPAFGRYRRFFPPEAVQHPAKAYTDVLEYLIKRYTRVGDLILDPMAGTGSTGVVAALHGRHAILVDIEERFVRWMRRARELVEKSQTLGPKGRIIVIHGDARELSRLLGEHSGEIASVITSPPFGEVMYKPNPGFWRRAREMGLRWGSRPPSTTVIRYESSKNIGSLPHGSINAIITSPPYAESISRRAGGPVMVERVGVSTKTARAYSYDDRNIGNLPFDKGWGGETYLEAMLKVYRECYKVLEPGGRIIIIIKPFIRGKRVVDLPYHTHLLLEKAGFKTIEVWRYRLRRLSFWRILYYRRHPEVPRIVHEYVLVAVK